MAERGTMLLSATKIVRLEAPIMVRLTVASWRSCAIHPPSTDAPHGQMMAVSNRTARSGASANGPTMDPPLTRTDSPGVMRLMVEVPNKAVVACAENGVTVSLPTRVRARPAYAVPLSRATASPFPTKLATATTKRCLGSSSSISLMAYRSPLPSVIMNTAPPRVRRSHRLEPDVRDPGGLSLRNAELPGKAATSTCPSRCTRSRMRSGRLIPLNDRMVHLL